MTRAIRLALLLAFLPLAAGCFTAPGLDGFTLAEVGAPLDRDFTWQAVEAYDAMGNAHPIPPELAGDAFPVAYQLDLPAGGGEPTLVVADGGALFASVADGVYRSKDQGRTWNLSREFLTPHHDVVQDQYRSRDASIAYDPATGRLFHVLVHPYGFCLYMAWSDDGGDQWTERPYGCPTPGGSAHPKILAAPQRSVTPSIPMRDYENLVYLCADREPSDYQSGTWCGVSHDGGMTWSYERPAYPRDESCGLTPMVGDSRGNAPGPLVAFPDGTVAFVVGTFASRCDRPLTVVVSEDNGFTWQARRCAPEYGQLEVDARITVSPDGTAYLIFRHTDQKVYLARSTDKFQSCDVFPVAPEDHVLNRFVAITSGDDGRLAMAYAGTRDTRNENRTPEGALLDTHWHLFVTVTTDAAAEVPTFTTLQVTPNEDPIQVGCVGYHYYNYMRNCGWNMFDAIDMGHDADGRWYVTFTDGCSRKNGCAGRPEAEGDFRSGDTKPAILVQDRGLSLFAEKGVLPSLGLEPLRPFEW